MSRRGLMKWCVCALGAAACATGSTGIDTPPSPREASIPASPAESATDPPPRAAERETAETLAAAPPAPAVPTRELPQGYLSFEGACDAGDVVTIAAVGDIMAHRELQRQAYRSEDHFRNLWASIVTVLGQADLTYGNLETPTAVGLRRNGSETDDPGMVFDNRVYSGYAKFNAHPILLEDLTKTGFDVVSTANNHALDREALGVDRTLDALARAGLPSTGTRHRGSEDPWHTVTTAKGMRIAWLACTKHTNFSKDEYDQVLECFDPQDRVRALVASLAGDPGIDAVIVTPHWGDEYSEQANDRQRRFAQQWIDAGATAIIGSHPHVLEPWDKLTAADGREAFVIYSLGNFISHQRTLNRRSTIILMLGLRKTSAGVRVVGARYMPLHVRMEGDKYAFFVEAIDAMGGQPADARRLVVGMFGEDNLLRPGEPLSVAPHCDPTWRFPSQR